MENEILEFFKDNFHVLLYGLAFIVSLLKYRKYFDGVLKFFPALIAYTFLTELLGALVLKNENFQIIYEGAPAITNSLIYNVYDIVFYVYFFYVFWKIMSYTKHKKVIKYGAVLFIALSCINPFFQNFLLYPQFIAISWGSILLVVCILLYMKQLKNRPIYQPLKENLLLWVCIGLLAFYPFYPIIIYIGTNYYGLYRSWLKDLHLILITLTYILFIIGFLQMKRMKPSDSTV